MCHIIFVHYHSSLLFPVNRILHDSLSICTTRIAILYIVKIDLYSYTCFFPKIKSNITVREKHIFEVILQIDHHPPCCRTMNTSRHLSVAINRCV